MKLPEKQSIVNQVGLLIDIHKNMIYQCIYVVYMMFVLNVYYSVFRTDYMEHLIFAFAAFGFYPIASSFFKEHRINRLLLEGIKGFLVPMVLVVALSTITSVVFYRETQNITSSIMRLIYYIFAFLIAYYSVQWFDKDSVKLIVISGIISYFTVFVKFIAAAGIDGLINPFNNSVNGISLEVHNLTYCFGLIFIYYLISESYTRNFKIKICCILAVMIILGNKRTLYLAIVAPLFMYYVFRNIRIRRKNIVRYLGFVLIIAAFVYIWLIKSGYFEVILKELHINDMSRLKFWNYFSERYSFSPFYWGRGISFTDNLMANENVMYELGVTAQTLIHNDILRAYIGWGFIPYLYYLFNFLTKQTKAFLKRKRLRNAWKYFTIASSYFLINFFDNMLTAVNFNIVFFVLWLLLVKDKDSKKFDESVELWRK